MKYTMKKHRSEVTLSPVKGKYMIKFKEGFDGENIVAQVNRAEHFKHVKLVPEDCLALVSFAAEAEMTQTFNTILTGIRQDNSVEGVITAFRDQDSFERYLVPGKLLVRHLPENQNKFITELDNKFSVHKKSKSGNWTIVNTPLEDNFFNYINHLNGLGLVEFSEPVYYGVNDAEDGSSSESLWNITSINLQAAWEITQGEPAILVAVIDGKPDLSHGVFNDSKIADITDENNFSEYAGLSSHSTQILGLMAGKNDSYAGIAPKLTYLPLVVKLEAQYYSDRAEAIFFLEKIMRDQRFGGQPVSRIIANCSWKTSGEVGIIRDAIDSATRSGVIFITSAGNDNSDAPHYPSDYSRINQGVISVASLTSGDAKAEYSNYSDAVDISAPGGDGLPLDSQDIYCPDVNNSFQYAAGTSFSAPHVAGAVALMLSVKPDLSQDQVKAILKKTASSIKEQNPQHWNLLGAGKLNIGAAVAETVIQNPAPNTGTVTVEEEPSEVSPVVQNVLQQVVPEIQNLIQAVSQPEGKYFVINMELESLSTKLLITL